MAYEIKTVLRAYFKFVHVSLISCVDKRVYVLLMSILLASTSSGEEISEDFPVGLYDCVQDNAVIVRCGKSLGSGFICTMDGAKWMVTNEHVTRSVGEITATFLDGKPLELIKTPIPMTTTSVTIGKKKTPNSTRVDVMMEVAANRDLVRIPVRTSSSGFTLNDNPEMGERVYTFGNSEGAGVLTDLRGRVVGVGPEEIEVDIPFVEGNSGGAIVNNRGEVCGVVTYATITGSPTGWIARGTRFNKPRRFGVRIRDIKWEKIWHHQYVDLCKCFDDIDSCIEYGLIVSFHRALSTDVYNDNDIKQITDIRLKQLLRMLHSVDQSFVAAFSKEFYIYKAIYKATVGDWDHGQLSQRTLTVPSIQKLNSSRRTTNLAYTKLLKSRADYWKNMMSYVRRHNWRLTRIKADSTEIINYCSLAVDAFDDGKSEWNGYDLKSLRSYNGVNAEDPTKRKNILGQYGVSPKENYDLRCTWHKK